MTEPVHGVTLIGYDGVDDLDLIGAASVLSKAAAVLGPSYFRIAAPRARIRGASGIAFDLFDHRIDIEASAPAWTIIVPGGPGAAAASDDPGLAHFIRRSRMQGARIYAICTGVLLLARNGLLTGRTVAMHHLKHDLLADAGCASICSGLVRDDWLTTIGGDAQPSCKSIDLTLQAIRDTTPQVLPSILGRMELADGRRLTEMAAA